jgi:hypothetical protein
MRWSTTLKIAISKLLLLKTFLAFLIKRFENREFNVEQNDSFKESIPW